MKRNEIFNAELDHKLKPETNKAIDMRQYSAPDRVHIYFGHLDCQSEQVQNSYSAETYLLNPSGSKTFRHTCLRSDGLSTAIILGLPGNGLRGFETMMGGIAVHG